MIGARKGLFAKKLSRAATLIHWFGYCSVYQIVTKSISDPII